MLLTPFALLDALTAYRVFAVLSLLMVVGAVLVVARELRLTAGVTVAVVLVVLASSPLHGTLLLGPDLRAAARRAGGRLGRRAPRPPAARGRVLRRHGGAQAVARRRSCCSRWCCAGGGRPPPGSAPPPRPRLLGVLVAGPASGLEWLRIGLTEPVPDTADNASLPGLAVRLGLPSAVGTVLGLAVLAGTLAALGRWRRQVDPAGTAPWAVLAAGLLMSPIAWHNYLMLLWPGVLLLLAVDGRTPYRPGRAAVLLAVAVIPVSWNALWPAGAEWALPGRTLYCVVLLAYWWVLLSSSRVRPVGSPTAIAESGEPPRHCDGRRGDVRRPTAARRAPPPRRRASAPSPAARPRRPRPGGT